MSSLRFKCVLCGGTSSVFFTRDVPVGRKAFSILECRSCGLLRTQPILASSELARAYTGSYYADDAFLSWRTQRARRKEVEGNVRAGLLLDIGCGSGSFLSHMRRHGWTHVLGVEPSASGRSACRRKGLRVLSRLQEVPPHSCDVVTMWHVLEHVNDFPSYVRMIASKLKPGGVLFVSVPNAQSFFAQLCRDKWFDLTLPLHLTHFTPSTLRRTLVKSGFNVAYVRAARGEHHWLRGAASIANFFSRRPQKMYADFKQRQISPHIIADLVILLGSASAAAVISLIDRQCNNGATITACARTPNR